MKRWWPKSQRPLTRWSALLMFVGIMSVHFVGILIFTRGFLLTRTELSEHSKCSDIQTSPCDVPLQGDDTCWTKSAVDRLVIIVFDALRFDFVAPSSFFEEKKPWMDKFHVMHNLATRQGVSAQIFKAIADPPTTSLQRLKGLTTGGLPTFIDVGNSFGAPAILEDNLIHQLVQNGKRVMMMGDDTWIQLFPDHFNTSFPFPSFNVKDLDTVDNGCIDHLLPSLYRDDWDVLIAHFLGVDHAGHIFGVQSAPMIDKLEQYNGILERVVEAMETQSGPGGLHENSLLVVMGDHGQTLNGDHGGGTAEEVETAMFAMSTKKPTPFWPMEVDASYCRSNVEGKNLCISSIQQLDFSVTVAALLGIPFPFGSLGKINPELYALATSVRNLGSSDSINAQNRSETEDWMEIYANSLCINSWQVKRYIDVYSGSSVIGFSDKDLMDIAALYDEANKIQFHASRSSLSKSKLKIDAYSKFLASVAGIARSKWTEFNLTMMVTGFSIMLASIFGHIFLIKWLDKYVLRFSPFGSPVISFEMIFGYIVVLIRSCSFLSNSFILEEGKVASFLLATTAIFQLRYALMKKKRILEAILLILLIPSINFGIQLGQFKQAVNSLFLKVSDSWMLGINSESYIWANTVEVFPIVVLIILSCLLFKGICQRSFKVTYKLVIVGTIWSYMLIAMYWSLDSHLLSQHDFFGVIRGNVIPRVVYSVSLLQVLFLAIIHLFGSEKTTVCEEKLVGKALAMLCSWSSTVILLSGKQGSIVALASLLGGWCIIRLMSMEGDSKNAVRVSSSYSSHTIQWNLLGVCLFFCTGHWCAFDGLRYAAAFIGFDEFNLIRQAILLTIETFGFSHILPIAGLPFLVAYQHRATEKGTGGHIFQLCLVYLIYGLIIVIGVTFTILCVIIQRRHLMVWGLFAPKFVFDVAALFLADFLICLASFYYIV